MSTSRRNFIKHGSMVALAASVPLGIAAKVSAGVMGSSAPSNGVLNKAAFESALNTKFLINANRSKEAVKLVGIHDLGSKAGGREAFSLTFRADASSSLKQNTYVIEHAQLGTFSFLLVPMRRDSNRPCYEAVINRLQ